MKKMFLVFLILCMLICGNNVARATTIFYDVSYLGSNLWQYNYAVVNDTLSDPITEFMIYFDYGLYQGLQVDSSVAGWTAQVVEPWFDITGGNDGFYDAIGAGGIAPGDSLSGFLVSFEWLGIGDFAVPGEQRFEAFGDNLAFLDSGLTTPTKNASVPEPGTLTLVGFGVICAAWLRRFIKPRR